MGNLVSVGKQRMTFALVLDTRAYNGKTVFADVLNDPGGTLIEMVAAAARSLQVRGHRELLQVGNEIVDRNSRQGLDLHASARTQFHRNASDR